MAFSKNDPNINRKGPPRGPRKGPTSQDFKIMLFKQSKPSLDTVIQIRDDPKTKPELKAKISLELLKAIESMAAKELDVEKTKISAKALVKKEEVKGKVKENIQHPKTDKESGNVVRFSNKAIAE